MPTPTLGSDALFFLPHEFGGLRRRQWGFAHRFHGLFSRLRLDEIVKLKQASVLLKLDFGERITADSSRLRTDLDSCSLVSVCDAAHFFEPRTGRAAHRKSPSCRQESVADRAWGSRVVSFKRVPAYQGHRPSFWTGGDRIQNQGTCAMNAEFGDLARSETVASPIHRWGVFPKAEAGEAGLRSVLVMVHGLGEHGGRYQRVGEQLSARGWNSLAHDLPGHGLNSGQRGDGRYEQMLDTVESAWRAARDIGRPRWIWGHSFGGNLVVNLLMRRGRLPGLEGALVTGPMFRAALPIPVWKRVAAQTLSKLIPRLSVASDIDPNDLTHDASEVKAYLDDRLNSSRISARLGKAMLDSAQWALTEAGSWSSRTTDLPLWIWHGAEDRITSCEASREFSERAGGGVHFEAWARCRHELHHETEAPATLSSANRVVSEDKSIQAGNVPTTFIERLSELLGPS